MDKISASHILIMHKDSKDSRSSLSKDEAMTSAIIKTENIVSGKTNLNTYDCSQVFEAFKDKDLGLIDSSIADSILQITTYNTLVYGWDLQDSIWDSHTQPIRVAYKDST